MNWKAVQAGVRVVIWEWDPIGVAEMAPDDEYDCLIAPIVRQVIAGASQTVITEFLRHELGSHFGLNPSDGEIESVADRLVNRLPGRRLPTDPDSPTECPACGAGPNQSSDPEHMIRSVCYCGHPRYYDYKHQDGTCPCLARTT